MTDDDTLAILESIDNEISPNFRKSIPLYRNEKFVELCELYISSNDEERRKLEPEFGAFQIEKYENITLKKGIDIREWRSLVNFTKLNSSFYNVTQAVIDLATKLDEGVDPITAMNFMAKKWGPTGIMQISIFSHIEEFHPRGEEVKKEWKKYCNRVYR